MESKVSLKCSQEHTLLLLIRSQMKQHHILPPRFFKILSRDRVTIDGVWIGIRIYGTLRDRNYK
jgi:hypothetical protein